MTSKDKRGHASLHKSKKDNDRTKSYSKSSSSAKEPYSVTIKVLAVLTVILGIFLGVYFMPPTSGSKNKPLINLATVSKPLPFPMVSYDVKCSDDYKDEKFDECKPKFCGRVISDSIVFRDEAEHLLGIAKKGFGYGGSSGGASILDLHSGALSKNDKFIDIYSILPENGEGGFTAEDFKVYRKVKNKIHSVIAEYFRIPATKLYLTKPTFFSRMNTTEAKTPHDEYWHQHVDKVTYGSFHYTSLLYLSTYGVDFTGGRFIFVDGDEEKAVEPKFGRVSFFTSGSENIHYVEKLKSGVRYAITISFTCDPKMAIMDPYHR